MSVNYEYGKCPAYLAVKDADEDSKEWREFANLIDKLIWALILVGFPAKSEWAITEENWAEVYKRIYIAERVHGAYRGKHTANGIKWQYFTPSEIVSMIGLRVNAGNVTDAKFKANMMKALREKADTSLRHWQSKLEKEAG